MLMYQVSRFDCYYCIKTLKTLEKLLQEVLFTCNYNGAEKHVACQCFENAASRAKTNFIATVHLFVKPQSRELTAHELPC